MHDDRLESICKYELSLVSLYYADSNRLYMLNVSPARLNTFAARPIFPWVNTMSIQCRNGKSCKAVMSIVYPVESAAFVPRYDLVLPRCQLVMSCGAGVRLSYMYWMTSILVSGSERDYCCEDRHEQSVSVVRPVCAVYVGLYTTVRLVT